MNRSAVDSRLAAIESMLLEAKVTIRRAASVLGENVTDGPWSDEEEYPEDAILDKAPPIRGVINGHREEAT